MPKAAARLLERRLYANAEEIAFLHLVASILFGPEEEWRTMLI